MKPESVLSPQPSQRRPGRPATGVGTPIQVRMQPDDLAALDRWIGDHAGRKPSRPQAIRALVSAALAGLGRR
jgi:hypothetical protein